VGTKSGHFWDGKYRTIFDGYCTVNEGEIADFHVKITLNGYK